MDSNQQVDDIIRQARNAALALGACPIDGTSHREYNDGVIYMRAQPHNDELWVSVWDYEEQDWTPVLDVDQSGVVETYRVWVEVGLDGWPTYVEQLVEQLPEDTLQSVDGLAFLAALSDSDPIAISRAINALEALIEAAEVAAIAPILEMTRTLFKLPPELKAQILAVVAALKTENSYAKSGTSGTAAA